jgi:hypothetical protein
MNHYASEIIAQERYRELRQEAAGGQRLALRRASEPMPTTSVVSARRTTLSTLVRRLRLRRVAGPATR